MTAVELAHRHSIEDLEVLVGLLDLDVGPIGRGEVEGHLRIYRSLASLGFASDHTLWRLGRLHLVEWGEAHYYVRLLGADREVKAGPMPLPILTPAGRRLALAEL